jgi:hypothetical protein
MAQKKWRRGMNEDGKAFENDGELSGDDSKTVKRGHQDCEVRKHREFCQSSACEASTDERIGHGRGMGLATWDWRHGTGDMGLATWTIQNQVEYASRLASEWILRSSILSKGI